VGLLGGVRLARADQVDVHRCPTELYAVRPHSFTERQCPATPERDLVLAGPRGDCQRGGKAVAHVSDRRLPISGAVRGQLLGEEAGDGLPAENHEPVQALVE